MQLTRGLSAGRPAARAAGGHRAVSTRYQVCIKCTMGMCYTTAAPWLGATLPGAAPDGTPALHAAHTQAGLPARLYAATEKVELATSNGAASAAASGVTPMDLEELSDIVRCVGIRVAIKDVLLR